MKEAVNATLRELIQKEIPLNTYLVHPKDVGFIPVGLLSPNDLEAEHMQDWSDILDADIRLIRQGADGQEVELKGVQAERLVEFDRFLMNAIWPAAVQKTGSQLSAKQV